MTASWPLKAGTTLDLNSLLYITILPYVALSIPNWQFLNKPAMDTPSCLVPAEGQIHLRPHDDYPLSDTEFIPYWLRPSWLEADLEPERCFPLNPTAKGDQHECRNKGQDHASNFQAEGKDKSPMTSFAERGDGKAKVRNAHNDPSTLEPTSNSSKKVFTPMEKKMTDPDELTKADSPRDVGHCTPFSGSPDTTYQRPSQGDQAQSHKRRMDRDT